MTKAVQEVVLDKHIKLLDSPGVVFASAENDAAAALRNAIKVGEWGRVRVKREKPCKASGNRGNFGACARRESGGGVDRYAMFEGYRCYSWAVAYDGGKHYGMCKQ